MSDYDTDWLTGQQRPNPSEKPIAPQRDLKVRQHPVVPTAGKAENAATLRLASTVACSSQESSRPFDTSTDRLSSTNRFGIR